METVKNCRKCDSGSLRYQEDVWGGYQNCVMCGWENLVWNVSEDKEDSLIAWQNHTEQRHGFAVHRVGLGSAVPTELKKKLQGGDTADQLMELGMGLARS